MNNIIPLRPADPIPFHPVVRSQTASEAITAGDGPNVGDYVRSVSVGTDDGDTGGAIMTPPGSGRVRAVHIDTANQSIRLVFDFAATIFIHGTTIIHWYPDPAREA